MKQLLILLALLLSSSTLIAEEQDAGAGATSPENEARLHAISSEKLREIMQNINLWVSETKNGEPQHDEKRMQDMADLIEAVEELLFHAELLSAGLPESNLNESELVTFRAMASQLYTEALDIQQLANGYEYKLIEPAYQRLSQTCIACHSLFRDK